MRFLTLTIGLAAPAEAGDAQTQEYQQRWGQWMASLAQRGVLESGLPLQWTGTNVTRDAATDLELQPVDIGGYMVIKADSLEEAIAISREAPHIELGGSTIIRPCLEPPA